jgi:hypothetical protein
MLDKSVLVVTSSERTGINRALQPVRLIKVSFMVNGHGPYFVEQNSVGFTQKAMEDAINAKAAELKGLLPPL